MEKVDIRVFHARKHGEVKLVKTNRDPNYVEVMQETEECFDRLEQNRAAVYQKAARYGAYRG